jgi:ribosomal protein L6P/L9E
MITSQNIALTTNYEVISVQDNEITLRVIPTDVILKIKNSKCHLTYDKDSHSIKIQYFKKWSKSIQSFINVWRKSLVKYDKAPLFEYEIEVLYKHFPIIVEKVKDKTLKISNFMGLKKDFLIDINSAISVQVLDKN